jgi:hypothetical protein
MGASAAREVARNMTAPMKAAEPNSEADRMWRILALRISVLLRCDGGAALLIDPREHRLHREQPPAPEEQIHEIPLAHAACGL